MLRSYTAQLVAFLQRLSSAQVLLIVIVVIGAFFRLWNFTNTLQFLGDQGRDAIVVKRIIKDFNPVLIGPATSTGNMYLGPLYYYMMAPFLWLSYPSPVGPAYAVAGLSIATIILIFYLGKEFVGETAALFAAALFSISAMVVTYSRFSWNPNPAPFFSIILLWAVTRALTKSSWYWVVCSVCVSVLMQLHYITLLTIPATGIFWLISAWKVLPQLWSQNQTQRNAAIQFLQSTLLAVIVFLAFFSPLVLFDFRHNFLNWHSFQNFIRESQGPVTSHTWLARATQIIKETHGRSLQALFEISIGQNRTLNTILLVSVLGILLWLLTKRQDKYHLGYQVLFTYFVVAIVGLSFYRGSVFIHYIAYLFPITFLIFGVVIQWLIKNKLGQYLTAIFLLGFSWWNVSKMPLKSLGWTITDVQHTSQTIYQHVKPGEKYNIFLFASSRDYYGENYRYFLTTTDKPPVIPDQYRQASTLFVIDEEHTHQKLFPSDHAEIQDFPNKPPTEVYTIPNGPDILVLRK